MARSPDSRLARDAVGIRGDRIEHEEPDESRRMPGHGGGDRRLITRHAGDERRPADAVTIELRNPSIGKGLGRFG